MVVDRVLGPLRELRLRCITSNGDTNDVQHFESLSHTFADDLLRMQQLSSSLSFTPQTVVEHECFLDRRSDRVERPIYSITSEVLEDFRSLGFTWTKIATMMGISRWRISKRINQYDLDNMRGFNRLTNEELENIIKNYIDNHGTNAGQVKNEKVALFRVLQNIT